MNEIDRILQKLETAMNLQKSGALTGPEYAQLRDYVKKAESLRLDVAHATHTLADAARTMGHTYRTAAEPHPFG
jgi:hypothetical protein